MKVESKVSVETIGLIATILRFILSQVEKRQKDKEHEREVMQGINAEYEGKFGVKSIKSDVPSYYLILDETVLWDSGKKVSWKHEDYPWFTIENGKWRIECGVAWDGCTVVPDGPQDPKKKGFPITWLASLVHDIGWEMVGKKNAKGKKFPYERIEIDRFFRRLLEKAGFKYSWAYFIGVVIYAGKVGDLIRGIGKFFNFPKKQNPMFIQDYCRGKNIVQIQSAPTRS